MTFKLELWIAAVLLAWTLVNAGYSYAPMHLAGSFVVPHTELTISYGVDPAAISKQVINASRFLGKSGS